MMIDSDSLSSGLSESIYLNFFLNHLRMVALWKPFLWQSSPSSKTSLTENFEHSEISHQIEQQKIYRSICAPSGGSEVFLRSSFQKTNMGFWYIIHFFVGKFNQKCLKILHFIDLAQQYIEDHVDPSGFCKDL